MNQRASDARPPAAPRVLRRRLVVTAVAVCGLLTASASRVSGMQGGDAVRDDRAVVFRAGESGYHTFRIPAIVATPTGDLLAFAEGRRHATADGGDIDVVMRRSRDGGRTWLPLVVVGDDASDTFGNPCVVLDRTTGTLWLFVIRTSGADRESAIIAGQSRSRPRPFVLSSTDDGHTWSTPRDLTASLKREDWTWYSLGPGIGIQARDGRLVIPGNHAVAGSGVHRSHLVISTDHGVTWRLGAVAPDGTNESQVVELSDGRLLHNMRNHPPRPGPNHRMIATSADGGLTLTPAREDPTLVEPPAQASLLAVAGRAPGTRAIVFSNPASVKRQRMTVRVSDDDGVTWRTTSLVDAGHAAYSCLVDLGTAIGLLYERGAATAYEEIVFVRLSRAALIGDAPPSRPRPE